MDGGCVTLYLVYHLVYALSREVQRDFYHRGDCFRLYFVLTYIYVTEKQVEKLEEKCDQTDLLTLKPASAWLLKVTKRPEKRTANELLSEVFRTGFKR